MQAENLSRETADAQDVWNLYNLVLRRDPESRSVIQTRIGHPIDGIFAEFVSSKEFSGKVLSALINNKTTALVPYVGTMSFGHLLVWANARLPVRPELRAQLIHARSWPELDEMLFLDPELRVHFPQLGDAQA